MPANIVNYAEPKHKSVKVIGNETLTQKMFKDRGYKVIMDYEPGPEPDLICFTGGADVDPHYYHQKDIACGVLNQSRDRREVAAYNAYIDYPKVGICRGGQLLNILSGGRMWQDVDGHGRDHEVEDLLIYQTKLKMTSTHHQMMIAGPKGDVIAIAHQAKRYLSADKKEKIPEYDTEVVYYEPTKSLCFQPHPEYVGKDEDCNVYFFELLNLLL